MPKKYHIETSLAPPRFQPIGKYTTIEFREDCAGSCRECVKKKCVYNIFKDNYQHMSSMAEPEYVYACMSCLRCIQECTKGIFSRVINPEYRTLGDQYWNADIFHRTWYQAHTGSIPVSGAGYRGPFVGQGFDSMWTDMSEIVRPTRDGIHGREYINTSIELSRRPERLSFNEDMSLAIEPPPILELPLPILFQLPSFGLLSTNTLLSIIKAAAKIGTLVLIDPANINDTFKPYLNNLVPMLTSDNYASYSDIIANCQMVELAYKKGIEKEFEKLRNIKKDLFISVGIPLTPQGSDIALELAQTEVDTLHYYADKDGRELNTEDPRFLKDVIREIHLKLVDNAIRQKINLLFSGGIAMAEHVNKAIICGADAVAIDNSLLIAMECRMCLRCKDGLSCPVKLEDIDSEYGCARIMNLMGAWRNQILELLGAMGLREVRRLKGEVGRSMWFEDLEEENFGPIFGKRKVPSF